MVEELKVLLHCAMFRTTLLLRDKLHEAFSNITYLATAENVARQVAAQSVAESGTRFYFLQRFQATFRFVAQSHEPVVKCEHFGNVSCNLFRNAF